MSGFCKRSVYLYISLHLSFSEPFGYGRPNRVLCWILFFSRFVFDGYLFPSVKYLLQTRETEFTSSET